MPVRPEEHLHESRVAALLDGSLSGAELAAAQSHLADCTACREEFAEAARMLETLSSRGTRRGVSWWMGASAVAAAILLVVLVPRLRDPDGGRPERRPVAESVGRLQVVWPREAGVVDSGETEFIWKKEDDASYRVTLIDSSGTTLWTTNTTDTIARLPREVVLPAGRQFHWYVDALRVDGLSVTSGLMSFRTAPP